MSAFTAQAKVRELTQRLQLLMPTAVITQALDANGYPAINVAYNTAVAQTKVLQDPAQSATDPLIGGVPGPAYRVNGLGLAQTAYSPHVIELLQDSDQTDADSQSLKARMHQALGKMGLKIFISQATQATILAAPIASFDTTFAAAAALITIPSDEINPMIQSS